MDRMLRIININFVKILDKVIKYCIDSYVFYYDSIDSYFSSKEQTLWRRTKYYLRFLLLVIFIVKYGLLSLYPDKLQSIILKDATIIFGKQARLVHAMFLSLGMVTLIGKLILLHYESRKNLHVFDMIVGVKTRKPMYQMSQSHLKKLTLRSLILYYGFIRISGSISYPIVIVIMTMMTTVTYLHHDYGNFIILWLWTTIIILTFN